MKWRNSKERELLSAGGTRESTLPTKNNPNPDLSDVTQSMPNSDDAAASRDFPCDVDTCALSPASPILNHGSPDSLYPNEDMDDLNPSDSDSDSEEIDVS